MMIITVAGRGKFPMDMLRYDQCSPLGVEDVAKIEAGSCDGLREQTHIKLQCWKIHGPTHERWRSFGWIVTQAK